MDILRLFKKRKPVLIRCTYCYEEAYLSNTEVRTLESHNTFDPVCTVKIECHFCHTGFMIPVNYTDKFKKQYLFHEIKPKIKNLDHNSMSQRIFGNHDNVSFYFFEDSL